MTIISIIIYTILIAALHGTSKTLSNKGKIRLILTLVATSILYTIFIVRFWNPGPELYQLAILPIFLLGYLISSEFISPIHKEKNSINPSTQNRHPIDWMSFEGLSSLLYGLVVRLTRGFLVVLLGKAYIFSFEKSAMQLNESLIKTFIVGIIVSIIIKMLTKN